MCGEHVFLENNVALKAFGRGHLEIQNHIYINSNVIVAAMEQITISKGTKIGPNVVIFDNDHDRKTEIADEFNGLYFFTTPIMIEKNVWIGANSIILKGFGIGKGGQQVV